ncbi:ABC transporter ATP-binding protein [Chloroflexota bacterium]
MVKPLLEVENLKTYFFTHRGAVKAVDGVSFSVERGETTGLVGESGCGKTITCLSILGLVPSPGKIVGGNIYFEDEDDLLEKSEGEMRHIRGRKISIILQDPMTSLNPAYSIGEQIAETIRLHQGARRRELQDKTIASLKLVRIPDAERRLGDYPHQMSGGMRQRVTGAIALSCHPSLLIADEPTTSLDVTTQAQYLELLREVQRESKISMIFITHDFGIVARMCDKVSVMYAGRIVETAPTRELFDNPVHPYTRALMGSIPKLEVRVEKLSSIEGQPPFLVDQPPGCNFAPRCNRTKSSCREEIPPQVAVGDGHLVSCWEAGK